MDFIGALNCYHYQILQEVKELLQLQSTYFNLYQVYLLDLFRYSWIVYNLITPAFDLHYFLWIFFCYFLNVWLIPNSLFLYCTVLFYIVLLLLTMYFVLNWMSLHNGTGKTANSCRISNNKTSRVLFLYEKNIWFQLISVFLVMRNGQTLSTQLFLPFSPLYNSLFLEFRWWIFEFM